MNIEKLLDEVEEDYKKRLALRRDRVPPARGFAPSISNIGVFGEEHPLEVLYLKT